MRARDHQRRITSQGGQDGVLRYIFDNIGEGGRSYVEFGFDSDGWSGGIGGPNTGQLHARGWSGLLLDGGHENADINLHREFITPENVAALFAQYRVAANVDYVSIDLDSSDVWVLYALLRNGTWRPRVISTEYNCNYPLQSTLTNAPWARWQKDANGIGDKMMGASLGALLHVATEFDYALVDVVHCLDAFWVRRDEIADPRHRPRSRATRAPRSMCPCSTRRASRLGTSLTLRRGGRRETWRRPGASRSTSSKPWAFGSRERVGSFASERRAERQNFL